MADLAFEKFWDLVNRIDEVLARRYNVRIYPHIVLAEVGGFYYDRRDETIYAPRSTIEWRLLYPGYYGLTEQEVLADFAVTLLHEVYHYFLDMCLKRRYGRLCEIPEVRVALARGMRPPRVVEEDLADQFAERILREEFPGYYNVIRKWKEEFKF